MRWPNLTQLDYSNFVSRNSSLHMHSHIFPSATAYFGACATGKRAVTPNDETSRSRWCTMFVANTMSISRVGDLRPDWGRNAAYCNVGIFSHGSKCDYRCHSFCELLFETKLVNVVTLNFAVSDELIRCMCRSQLCEEIKSATCIIVCPWASKKYACLRSRARRTTRVPLHLCNAGSIEMTDILRFQDWSRIARSFSFNLAVKMGDQISQK